MNLATQPYVEQALAWPQSGKYILAHFDDETIVVYQAFNVNVANYALKHGQFGGPHYSFARMSWIKPNFLWMMYRCGWASKDNQEAVLGLRIRRAFFESILREAVPSFYDASLFVDHADWQSALKRSEVRLQWDPDHDPLGAKQARRAIQLGLRGPILAAFATVELKEVIDMTPFVHGQAPHAGSAALLMPVERAFRPQSAEACARVGLD